MTDLSKPVDLSALKMPVDSKQWADQLGLVNFINAYYQYRDVARCTASGRVLVLGPGQGLDPIVLRWRGYEVVTVDIDTTFSPDVVASAHDLACFADKAFDVVVASHVLEHLPLRLLDAAIAELARVAKFALVYLPIAGRRISLGARPGFGGYDWQLHLDLFNYFDRPDGEARKYMAGHHYWEVGLRGFRVADMERRFAKCFSIVDSYRNRDWPISWNFVLRSNASEIVSNASERRAETQSR
jgi:SAM-dependent methyltransferase